MLLYSIIFPIISLLAIIWFLIRYLKGKNSLLTVILWAVLWLFVILFSIFPELSMDFAKLFGVARGLDFIIIVVFAVMLYTIFKVYYKLDKLEDDVNKIVKEVALSNEISVENEDE